MSLIERLLFRKPLSLDSTEHNDKMEAADQALLRAKQARAAALRRLAAADRKYRAYR